VQLGYEEAGKGRLLVLIHGFPLDRTIWKGQLSGLSDKRRVVAVDMRGRGKSPATGSWSVDELADDVAETIEALGEEKADVAGVSMGGYVAFALLRRRPEMIRSLILIDTKAGADNEEAKAAREKTAETVRSKGTGALVGDLGVKVVAPEPSDEVRAEVRRMFESIPGESSAADALAMRDRPDSTADAAAIRIPVLVIHGEQDQLMPVAVGEELAKQIPGAEFVRIPGAGHLSPLENTEAVNDAIRRFLEKNR
jgi:3-oxoadipate enol-lactonase